MSVYLPRKIDHLVMPVEKLEQAVQRYSALGFTCAPVGKHPFGTENACIYFADGTFLEPLGIDQREKCEATALKGNVFTARDQAFRFRKKQGEGISAIAFKTDNADEDHLSFRKAGISAGKKLKFSRFARDDKGNKARAEFKLAFAADLRAPDAFLFTCETVSAPKIDRSALTNHANGVAGIKEVVLGEVNPTDFQYLLQKVMRQREVNAHSFGIELEAGNANIGVYSPEGLKAWYGITGCSHGRGLKIKGVVLGVDHLDKTEALLEKAGIETQKIAHRLIVPPKKGQGGMIGFEQNQ